MRQPKLKTIILSYFFPPGSTGAATVMYNLCKHLPVSSYVVITARPEFAVKQGAYDKNLTIEFETIRLPVFDSILSERLKFFLFAVLSGLSLNRKRKLDCILAVYPYFSGLFAGYILSKVTGKPLVVYMHDLFSEAKRQARLYCIWRFLENRVLKSASTILVMNKKYVNHYSNRGIRNLVLFPPSISLSESDLCEHSNISSSHEDKCPLEIVFTGSAYAAHEDAIAAFLKAAKTVKGLHVSFATPMNFGLTENLRQQLKEVSIGFLDKQSCLSLQRNADVLFLPLAFRSPYPDEIECAFPCKLLEYLVAGKPILAVVPENSFVASLIRKHNVGIAVTTPSIEKIVEALERLKDGQLRDLYGCNAAKTARLFDSRLWSQRLDSMLSELCNTSNK